MANRYWVGGTGTWNGVSTANWATASGGVSGASAPTVVDNVTFDANSGSGIVTTAAGSTCNDAVLNFSDVELVIGASHVMTNRFTLSAGTLNLNNNTLTCGLFKSDSGVARTLNINGGVIELTAAGTHWDTSPSDNLFITENPIVNVTYAGATACTFATGVLNEATAPSVNFSAGTYALTLTSFFNDIVFTGFSGTLNNGTRTIYGDFVVDAGMTLNAGASAITFADTSSSQQITTAGKTLDMPLTFNGIGGTFAFQDALTQGSTRAFTITNGTVQLKNGVTSTVGAFATSSTNQKFLQSTLAGSQATLSQASGTVNASNLTIQDINATGGATWQAFTTNNNVDAGNNLGWDFSTQIGRYIYTRRKNKRILP
jgi:hypothetical protein